MNFMSVKLNAHWTTFVREANIDKNEMNPLVGWGLRSGRIGTTLRQVNGIAPFCLDVWLSTSAMLTRLLNTTCQPNFTFLIHSLSVYSRAGTSLCIYFYVRRGVAFLIRSTSVQFLFYSFFFMKLECAGLFLFFFICNSMTVHENWLTQKDALL